VVCLQLIALKPFRQKGLARLLQPYRSG